LSVRSITSCVGAIRGSRSSKTIEIVSAIWVFTKRAKGDEMGAPRLGRRLFWWGRGSERLIGDGMSLLRTLMDENFSPEKMAMNDVAHERRDSRFEQRRIFCRDVSCGRSRSLQARFSLGNSLRNRHRLLQCDLCTFFRASVLAFSDRSLPLSYRRPMNDRSSCDLRYCLFANMQPLGLSTVEVKRRMAVMQSALGATRKTSMPDLAALGNG